MSSWVKWKQHREHILLMSDFESLDTTSFHLNTLYIKTEIQYSLQIYDVTTTDDYLS